MTEAILIFGLVGLLGILWGIRTQVETLNGSFRDLSWKIEQLEKINERVDERLYQIMDNTSRLPSPVTAWEEDVEAPGAAWEDDRVADDPDDPAGL